MKTAPIETSAIEATLGPGAWGLLIALSLLWGGSFFFAEVALEALPPLSVVLARVALGALALLAVVRAAGLRLPRDVRLWRAFFAMGALNNLIPFSLIVWGQTEITGGLAAILLGASGLGERLSAPQLAGMGLITLGLAAIDGRILRCMGGARCGAAGVRR